MKEQLIRISAVIILFLSVSFTVLANPFADDVVVVNIKDAPYAEDVRLTIADPVPDEMLNTPPVCVAGYEMDAGRLQANPFTGDFVLESDGSRSIAKYKNGSVAVLHHDGTFVGVGYDGCRVTSNPLTGHYEKVYEDGTTVTYEPGKDLMVEKPDGDIITVKPDGNTTVVRSNGLISEHDSNGNITGIGISGSDERIDMQPSDGGGYVGGEIGGSEGKHLKVDSDGSFTYRDEDNTTYHISNNNGNMEAEADRPGDFGLKVDNDALTLVQNGEKYRFDFDENGIATIPLSEGGSVKYNRDDDGFTFTTESEDFDFSFDENGNLVEADDDGFHLALRVNPDGSITSGKFKKDENGELVEINEDGSGTYEKDGGKLEVGPEGAVKSSGFDWFDDFDDPKEEETGKEKSESPGPVNDEWKNYDLESEIEPLNIHLRLYYTSSGSKIDLDDQDFENIDTPLNVSVVVTKDGDAEIFLPAYEYQSEVLHHRAEEPYIKGNHAQLSLKGKIQHTYRIMDGGNATYVEEGVITQKAHYVGGYEKYCLDDDTGEYFKALQFDFDMDVDPCESLHDGGSYFKIYYFTDKNMYQLDMMLCGNSNEYDYYKSYHYDYSSHHNVYEPEKDTYRSYIDEYETLFIDAFDGNDPSDFGGNPEGGHNTVIDRELWYGISGG